MASVREVRAAMADAVNRGTGLRSYSIDLDQIAAPCAVISRAEYDPRYIFTGGKRNMPFKVRVFVNRTAERSALEALDNYGDPEHELSVIAAVTDGDLWPDQLVDSVSVVLVSEVREATWAGGGESYFMIELDVEVIW